MKITKFYCDLCGTECASVGKIRLDKYRNSNREYTKEFNDLCKNCYDRIYNFLDDIYTVIKDSSPSTQKYWKDMDTRPFIEVKLKGTHIDETING